MPLRSFNHFGKILQSHLRPELLRGDQDPATCLRRRFRSTRVESGMRQCFTGGARKKRKKRKERGNPGYLHFSMPYCCQRSAILCRSSAIHVPSVWLFWLAKTLQSRPRSTRDFVLVGRAFLLAFISLPSLVDFQMRMVDFELLPPCLPLLKYAVVQQHSPCTTAVQRSTCGFRRRCLERRKGAGLSVYVV